MADEKHGARRDRWLTVAKLAQWVMMPAGGIAGILLASGGFVPLSTTDAAMIGGGLGLAMVFFAVYMSKRRGA